MEFKKNGVTHKSIKEFTLTDGTIIGIFEGERGYIIERDIIIELPPENWTEV